ncbi:GIY-YIG nuclease family protein [Gracilibacillus phocaeensis]|uniref:GIY-YIG nuclease family protein n=1 Tax=Gracilibacillus phocaeensis TaxID=2042304 RepID=UPI0025703DC7|nr:GIY-YIG nuclease family protein [Gracilibacillus phocaeensis]
MDRGDHMPQLVYSVNEEDTLYAIQGYLSEEETITIGKLGTFDFDKGWYVYVGSAKRHITSRIQRHLQLQKKQRWHIDYLRPFLQMEAVQTYPGAEGECGLFQRLRTKHEGDLPVKGFGSSDCKCYTHLFYVKEAKADLSTPL